MVIFAVVSNFVTYLKFGGAGWLAPNQKKHAIIHGVINFE